MSGVKLERCLETIKPCDISKYIKLERVFRTDTASGATMVIGKMCIRPTEEKDQLLCLSIIIKINVKEDDSLANSIDVERQIYKQIVNKLLINKNTPCLTQCYGYYDCESVDLANDPLYKNLFINESAPLQLLFTEYIRGTETSLRRAITRESVQEDLFSVLFMIFYTLHCFELETLQHHDLHFENILIQETKEYEDYYFELDDQTVKIRTKCVPKIYDFDQASVISPSVENNITIDYKMCNMHGICNELTPNRDLFMILYRLNKLTDLVNKNGWLEKLLQYSGILNYNKIYDKVMKADGFPPPSTFEFIRNDIKNAKEMCRYMISLQPHIIARGNFPNIFKPPAKRKIILKNPVYKFDPTPQEYKFPEEHSDTFRVADMRVDIVNDLLNKFKTAKFEYLAVWVRKATPIYYMNNKPVVYDIATETVKLFMDIMNKKKLTVLDRGMYMAYIFVCIALSLTGTFQVSRRTVIMVLFMTLSFSGFNVSREMLGFIYDDILITYNGTLPILIPYIL